MSANQLIPRDPKRIRRILGLLEHAWNRYPDLRLGQLYVNLMPEGRACELHDVFVLEDDMIEANLEQFLNDDQWPRFKSEFAS